MKSLLKADGSTPHRTAAAWQPADFESVQNARLDVQREEMMALFGSVGSSPLSQKSTPVGTALRPESTALRPAGSPAASTAHYDSWQPGEFEQPIPVALEDWSFPNGNLRAAHSHGADSSKYGQDYDHEVAEMLTQAREQADEIILQAQQSADETLLQVQEEVDRTIAEGYQKGWAKAREEAEAVIQAAHALLEQVNQWREQMLAETENSVVGMIKEISQVMFGEGLVLDNSALQVNYNRVVENAKALGDLKIYINTQDAAVLDHSWGDFQTLITGNKVQVIPSDEITRGGCFVQGQMGTVDARVETELKNVLEAIAAEQASAENMA